MQYTRVSTTLRSSPWQESELFVTEEITNDKMFEFTMGWGGFLRDTGKHAPEMLNIKGVPIRQSITQKWKKSLGAWFRGTERRIATDEFAAAPRY